MECDAFHVSYLSDKIPEAVFHGQPVKTVAYLRVSTAQQDVGSQRLAILEYARKHDFRIDDFIEATASGQASEKRRLLDELMNVLQRGDRLVVSDLSRLGRSLKSSRDPRCPRQAPGRVPYYPLQLHEHRGIKPSPYSVYLNASGRYHRYNAMILICGPVSALGSG